MDLSNEWVLDSSWNVMAYGDAREGNWRANVRMERVASTLHTTSEHGVPSITTANAHTSAASSRLNWSPLADLNWLVRFAERRNLVSARVPSHLSWPLHPRLPYTFTVWFLPHVQLHLFVFSAKDIDPHHSNDVYTLTCNKEAAGSDKNIFISSLDVTETKHCNRNVNTNDIGVRILTCRHFNTAS
jgi:hypothetical protein